MTVTRKALRLFLPSTRPARTLIAVLLLIGAGLPAFAAGPQQMRGVWMHATQIKTRAEADACVARIQRANLNAVFLLVWYWGGQAFYHSQLCPLGEDVEQGYDPLGHMIAQCHQRGIEVHAWYVNGSYGAAQPLHVLDKHPEWAVQTDGGNELWYDFGKPQVRKFQSDLMIECLRNYDLDGIHFDYIRYGPKVCWCNHCQEEFAARYGLVPVVSEKRLSFPIVAPLSGNPVAEPTTAKVLAQFSDGAAAIVTNQLGKGKVLLLNWHACRQMPPPVAETIRRALQIWNAPRDKVFVVDTAPNRREYGRQFARDAVAALQRLGYRAKLSDEDRLAELPKDSLLVMAAVYLIPDETAQQLEQFVQAGGILLVIDGPVRSIRKAPLQRVLGMKSSGRYFNRTELILPAGPSDLLPSSDRKIDLEEERSRLRKWAEYRKSGVTELVRDVYRRAKQIKPKAQVTAAVFTPLASAENVFQDWPGWLREGIIDYVIPMAYTADNHALATQLQEWKTIDPQLERIVPGLSIYRRTVRGPVTRDTNLILSQRQLCIENGAHGNLFFSLHYLNDPLIDLLTSGPHRDKVPAYRPPPRKAP